MKILEPISYLEVAGKPRNRPEKTDGRIGERERESRERREKASENGNFRNGSFLKCKLPGIVTQLPLTITFAYEFRFKRT